MSHPIPSHQTLYAVLVGAVVVFLVLAATAGVGSAPGGMDRAAHPLLYGAIGAGRLPVVWAITWLGNNATLSRAVKLLALALLAGRRPLWALRLVVAWGGSVYVITVFKALFSRERPLEQIVATHGWSFPSGHAFAATVFYGMLVAFVWRATPRPAVRWTAAMIGALVVLAVGLSRVYLNVHYVTDVVAGWAGGLAWLVGSQFLVTIALGQWRRRRRH